MTSAERYWMQHCYGCGEFGPVVPGRSEYGLCVWCDMYVYLRARGESASLARNIVQHERERVENIKKARLWDATEVFLQRLIEVLEESDNEGHWVDDTALLEDARSLLDEKERA